MKAPSIPHSLSMTTQPSTWPPYCLEDTGTTPGCQGIQIDGYTHCLAHLSEAERASYLQTLRPGADIEALGVKFTRELLAELTRACHDPEVGRTRLGKADFRGGEFPEGADFNRVLFDSIAFFEDAKFGGRANFEEATFGDQARFGGTTFAEGAEFHKATFEGTVDFDEATFKDTAWFEAASFRRHAFFRKAQFNIGSQRTLCRARFDEATFDKMVHFEGAVFGTDADFDHTRFETARQLGPLTAQGALLLDRAEFGGSVTIAVTAARVSCAGTRFDSSAELQIRYAELNLAGAVLSQPVIVASMRAPVPSQLPGTILNVREDGTTEVTTEAPSLIDSPEVETWFSSRREDATASLLSLYRVDTAQLVLNNIDLRHCQFAGAYHLDQLRMEGICRLSMPPKAWRWGGLLPRRWTGRRTLIEEHYWRALPHRSPTACAGWEQGPYHPDRRSTPSPATVASLYRQLRKALEDGKNEPGADDFYYGEMEMRRHDRDETPKSERLLLHAYWLLSGYGLRAARALGWLFLAVTLTLLLTMAVGLPDESPKQVATGINRPVDTETTFVIDKRDPRLTISARKRFTWERFDKSLRITLNSVVFRSSGEDLTTTGTYIEIVSRITEPILLGLAALAIRGRIKRG